MKIISSRQHKKFENFVTLSIIEGFLTTAWIASIPADPKNALFFGLSLQRIILLSGTILGIVAFSAIIILFSRNTQVNERISGWLEKQTFSKLSYLSGFTLVLIMLIPEIEWGKWSAIFYRIQPLLIWICLIAFQWVGFAFFASGHSLMDVKVWVKKRFVSFPKSILIAMGVLISIYILSIILYPKGILEDAWYEIGVPILGWQLIVCGAAGLLYFRFEMRLVDKFGKKTDLIFFILIFVACGILWGSGALTQRFFNPGPFPPNNVYYPYSDAAKYDLQAQSALLGFGFDNGTPLDRPFYPLILAIIHLLSGQSYASNMVLQAFIFGVFPAIVYLICAEIGSRRWGVAAALAIIMWGTNTLNANLLLSTATPKQILSDFPMAIFLSLVLFFTIKWLKASQKSLLYACVAGGMIALAAYIRYSALLLLPAWMLIALIKNRRSIKKGLIEASLIFIGFLILTMPWYARNLIAGQNFGIPFSTKVVEIVQTRLQPKTNPQSNQTSSPQAPVEVDAVETTKTPTTPNQKKVDLSEGGNISNNFIDSVEFVSSHLIHNLMSSFLVLPTSLEVVSLGNSIKLGGDIYTARWLGVLPPIRLVILLIQFFILSVGFFALFSKNRVIAVSVILMFFCVQLANALGRTSGGRYIVPVDWLVILPYFAGLFFLIGKLDLKDNAVDKFTVTPISKKQWIIGISTLFIIGALPWLFERIAIASNPHEDPTVNLEQINSLPGLDITEGDLNSMSLFLNTKATHLLKGDVFYPTLREKNAIIEIPGKLAIENQQEILIFNLLDSKTTWSVFFPYQKSIEIQNLDIVILTGCTYGNSIVVRDLIIIRSSSTSYFQSDVKFDSCDQLRQGLKK